MGNGALPERKTYIPLSYKRGFPGTESAPLAQTSEEQAPSSSSAVAFTRHSNRQSTLAIPLQVVPPAGTGDVLQINYIMSFGKMETSDRGASDRGLAEEGHVFLKEADVPKTWDERYTLPYAMRDVNYRDHFGNGTNLSAFTKDIPLRSSSVANGLAKQYATDLNQVGSIQVSTQDGPSLPVKTTEVPLLEVSKKIPNREPVPVFYRTQISGINHGAPRSEEIYSTVLHDSGYQRE